MSTVKLVPNKKASALASAPVYHTVSSNGKSYRVQVSGVSNTEVRPGLVVSQNRVGFMSFTSEDTTKVFIAKALDNDGVLPGKVIYVDQLTPILSEAQDFGKRYPYPMSFNGIAIPVEQRMAIAKAVIAKGLTLQAPDADGELKTIYRSKVYTELVDATDHVINTIGNQAEIDLFMKSYMAAPAPDAKAARIAQLKGMTKAQRVAAGVQEEYVDLIG